MKEKIKSIMVISFFCLSICFLSLSLNKNNKKENVIEENNSKVIINVESKKYGLYKRLENELKEDYSYKEIKTIVNDICNCNISEEKVNDINNEVVVNNVLDSDKEVIKEETVLEEKEKQDEKIELEEKLEEDKDIVIDGVINEEIIIDEEITDNNENEKISEEIIEETKDIVIEERKEEIVEENSTEEVVGVKQEIILNDDNESLEVEVNNSDIVEENKPILKNGFYEEDGCTYYYEDDKKVTGLKVIDGVNHYFSPVGKYLGTNNIKVIDVSYYQGNIDWNLFVESDCYGVILRIGYYDTLDKKFEEYIKEIKGLNIPYGIYLFSYSTTITGSLKEAAFTNSMISKYNLEPTLGIYYDIESWSSKNGATSNNISKDMYDKIITNYISEVSNYVKNKYKVKVYTGRWYAYNRLSSYARSYVDWVAEYNSTCKYYENYSMWQYTSKGSVPGINGNVDISYIL